MTLIAPYLLCTTFNYVGFSWCRSIKGTRNIVGGGEGVEVLIHWDNKTSKLLCKFQVNFFTSRKCPKKRERKEKERRGTVCRQ